MVTNASYKGSQPAVAVVSPGNLPVPNPPTDLSAVAVGATVIDLVWAKPIDSFNNVDPTISGYKIEISSGGVDGPWSTRVPDTESPTGSHSIIIAPETTRHFRVRAINNSGESEPSNVAAVTTGARSAPDAPIVFDSQSTPTTIDLVWVPSRETGGSAIIGYRIDSSPDVSIHSSDANMSWSNLVNLGATTTTYTEGNLQPLTGRSYRIYAINSIGSSTPSYTSIVTKDPANPTPPNAPQGLGAEWDSQKNGIELNWNTSYNGGAALTGHEIEVSSDAGLVWSPLENVGPGQSTYLHVGLPANTTRHYRVRAVNVRGPSPPSNIASATTGATTTVTSPDAPTDLTASVSGPNAIDLSWTEPANTGGSAITGYRIQVSLDGNTGWTNLHTGTSTTYTHSELIAGTTRYYRVYASNQFGESGPSNTANATTSASVTAPDAPTDLTASASGANTIDLSWTEPANTGGSAITGYRIQVSLDGNTGWTNLHTGTSTTYTHSELIAGTTRYYRVYASNQFGESDPSNTANATTSTSVTAPDAPTGLMATASGPNVIDLSWTEPANTGGAAITEYRLEASPEENTGWINLYSGQSTTYTDERLEPGTTRYYRVYASNALGLESRASNVVNATTTTLIPPPDAPIGLTASASGPSTIDLSWTEPASTGGEAITGYRIQVSPEENMGWKDLHKDTLTTTYTHNRIEAETTRYYRVYASNSFGESGASNIANATTSEATVPAAPTNLIADPFGKTDINLSWNEPLENGGSPITGYRIEVSRDGKTGSWTDLETKSVEMTTYTHRGLRPATTRHYRIYALNAIGESESSGVVSATTGGTGLQFTGEVTESHVYTTNTVIPWYVLPEAYGGTPPYTYMLAPALPEGLAFDASMRTISGTPTEVISETNYIYQAKDEGGTTTDLSFTIEVVEAVAFKIMITDQSFARGQLLDPLILPDASGGVAPILYELMPGLPRGLSFDVETRALSGSPLVVTQAPMPFKYRATDVNGSSDSLSFTIEIFSPVSVENALLPESFTVHGNYPNPFNPSTRIEFDLSENARVMLRVMDVLGRELMVLPVKEFEAGYKRSITLNTTNLASGTYLYQVIAKGSGSLQMKIGYMTLLK